MSGIQPIGSFIPTNYSGQASGSAYPLAIDADLAVAQRLIDSFAPRPLPQPAMALTIDPGHLFNGADLIEVGAWTYGTVASGSAAAVVQGPTSGIAVGQSLTAYYYASGLLVYCYAGGPSGSTYVTGFTSPNVTANNIAPNGSSSATLIFGQMIANVAGVSCTVTNGSNVVTNLTSIAGFAVGMAFTTLPELAGFAAGTMITSIDSATQIHVSNNFTGATTSSIGCTVTLPVPVSQPRIDRVVISRTTGAALWVEGVENASPVPPAIPLGYAPCCQIALTTGSTAITGTASLTDERDLASLGMPMLQPKPYQYTQPASGGSVTINDGVELLIVDPAAALATLTLTMPAHPLDGQRVGVSFSQDVTTLTMNGNSGQTLGAALTSAAVGGNFGWWVYRAANAAWYRGG